MFRTSARKKRLVGIALFGVILALFFSFNRFPKLDIVGEDLEAVNAPAEQCFQGFCIEREAGTSFVSRWWSFSITYLRLVTVGMTFAFLVAGLTEGFLFPSGAGTKFLSGGLFARTIKGAALGPVLNLCSACIVPVSSAFRNRGGGIAGAIALVQGSATMNIPALAMVFFVFTPLLGFSRLLLAVIGALLIGPIVVLSVRKQLGADGDEPEPPVSLDIPVETPWGPALTEGFRDWARVSIGYLVRMGPIMVVAGFASGLVIQWISPQTVSEYLGNDVLGVAIAATVGVLINVPLLFEIPLVALLLLMGMGTAPAATLLFAAAAGGPVTFWGLARVMPRRAIATFAAATWALGALGGLGVMGVLTLVGEPDAEVEAATLVLEEPPRGYDGLVFMDVSAKAGVDFLHSQPAEMEFPFGAGVVIFDYNGDGRDDIFVANSDGANALYRNEGDSTFTDVAAAAGVDDPTGQGNGGCAADYDNDGDRDLLITSYGSLRFFRNAGDGTFTDATKSVIGEPRRPYRHMGCAWGDYDRDGFLDLAAVRHIYEDDPDLLTTPAFTTPLGGVTLYHNDGQGALTDVTHLLGDPYVPQSHEPEASLLEAGFVGAVLGAGFQPAWLDYDNDGDPDLYVVNDVGNYVQANVLWRNDGPDGASWAFADVSLATGAGVNMDGMATAVGDYDLDGWLDLYLTNVGSNVLLNNGGNGLTFTPSANEAGVSIGALGEMLRVSWAAAFFDYDNDGDEDLYVVSGHLKQPQFLNPVEQPNALFRNNGDGTFADVSPESGADHPGLGRGGGYLDFNDDGCLDLFFGNYRQRAVLLQNACSGYNWLSIDTRGTASNRDGVGARISVIAGGRSQIREVSAGSSSISQSTMRAHFGLGKAKQADYVVIRWPSGVVQTLAGVAANQTLVVTEPE